MEFPIFDTKDAVPEAFRDSYEEKDGKWKAKASDSSEELNTEKKKRLQLLAEKKEEEKRRLEAEKERDDLKRAADAKSKGISEDELQKIRDDEAKARKPIEDENLRLKSENDQLKRTDKVRALASKLGIMGDRLDDAMVLLDPRTALTDAGTIAVKDKDGKVTAETIDDFLSKTFKTEKPWLYSGSDTQGSGSEGSRGGNGEGSYDPVAAGKKDAAEQKKEADGRKLAFT